MTLRLGNSKIAFDAPPPIGTEIIYGKRGVRLTLIAAEQHKRKNGSLGWLLTWPSDKGWLAKSGLRSNGVTWEDMR